MLEQQGDRRQAAELYDLLGKELSKYSSQYRALANRLNDCVEMLIDDEAWAEAEKVAKSAYVASIQAWRVASHPFVQISLQNLQYVLKKQGKQASAEQVRAFAEKMQASASCSGGATHNRSHRCCEH